MEGVFVYLTLDKQKVNMPLIMVSEALNPKNVADASMLFTENPHRQNPMLNALIHSRYDMSSWARAYRSLKNRARAEAYMKGNVTEMARSFGRLPDFSADPLDLIAMWAHLDHADSRHPLIASLIVVAYASRGVAALEYNKLGGAAIEQALPYRYLSDGGELPDFVGRDRRNLGHLDRKLGTIRASLETVAAYLAEDLARQSTPLLQQLVDGLEPAVNQFNQSIQNRYIIQHSGVQLRLND